MKSVSIPEAQANIDAVVRAAQRERIVLTRAGKPSVLMMGLEAYDEEDLRFAGSAEFWQMIEARRRRGKSIPLSELKARLKPKRRAKRK
jgi:prevent-host-death family protein